MRFYKIKLIRKQEIAKDTWGFYFERPTRFNFLAGQYVDLYLLGVKSSNFLDDVRTMTMANSPKEDLLLFIFRYRDSFYKKHLLKLSVGDSCAVTAPMGYYLLPKLKDTPIVFIAGGVGVAPFRSMILDEISKKSRREMTLFYSNKALEEAAFLEELRKIASSNSNFKLIPTVTQQFDVGRYFKVEKGRIDEELISKYVSNISSPLFCICGYPDMVIDIRQVLKKMGISSSKIITETFDGY